VEFQETMTFRTEYLMNVLSAGFHFVTADLDGVWLSDPIPHFNNRSDLQGQMHKETKISGGFVVVRATSYGKYFWDKVIQCQRDNAQFLSTHDLGTYEPSKYTEQYCINELSRDLASHPSFSRSLLDPWLFPDGKSFFTEMNSQIRGIHPVIIHNNWIKGKDQKLGRLKDWSLTSADETSGECLLTETLPSPDISEDQPIQMIIRIVAYNRPEALTRLLDSLLKADYANDKIILQIAVDHPVPSPLEDDVVAWNQVKRIANEFSWPYGEKQVIFHDHNIGIIGQWMGGWKPERDNEICLFLEDDIEVSALFYTWLRRAVQHFYVNRSQFDPNLLGISIQQQHLMLGETYVQRYGSRTPRDLLGRNEHLYKYQLPAVFGTAFFPQQWRVLLNWLEEKQLDKINGKSPISKACVPTLVSNTWWLANPYKAWRQWFNRFTFEKGFYTLYTNFPRIQPAQGYSVATHQPSFYYKPGRSSGYQLITSSTPIPTSTDFPDSSQIPVFDFHFNRLAVPDVLKWRKNIYNEKYVDQCWVIGSLAEKLRADQLQKEKELSEKLRLAEEMKKAKEAAAKAVSEEENEVKLQASKAKTTPSKTASPKTTKKTNSTASASPKKTAKSSTPSSPAATSAGSKKSKTTGTKKSKKTKKTTDTPSSPTKPSSKPKSTKAEATEE
jgi:hypothetical protein